MYTQCPDCSTAFRVTADVLKQAAGKVRCGGCGNAFNALAYLSESMPERHEPQDLDSALPELHPDTPPDDGLPASISAEQSAALLKTLDELAGSDIRIEDTGAEWRVFDDNEFGGAAADESVVNGPTVDRPVVVDVREELTIDEVLEESPTPIDQFLTETPAIVDAPEMFEEEAAEPTKTSVDELRFDDNTPLPDDFDLESGVVDDLFSAEAAQTESEPASEPKVEDDPPEDLDLSEPGEWTDILGEFDDLPESFAEDEFAAEAAPTDDDPVESAPAEEEFAAEAAPTEAAPTENDPAESVPAEGDVLDMDSQFALQAEAMGIDLSGMHPSLDADEDIAVEADVDLDELLNDSNSEILELEDLLDEELVEETEENDIEDAPEELTQLDLIDADDDIVEEDIPELLEDELEDEPKDELEAERDVELDDELGGDPEKEPEEELEAELETELETELEAESDLELDDEFEEEPADEPEQGMHHVPPLTEEEQSINMQIDQDLLALAVEDEDGFASTIIIPEATADGVANDEKGDAGESTAAGAHRDTGAGFETIIMEGEAFRSAEDLDQLEIDTSAAAVLAGVAAAERDAEKAPRPSNRRYGIIGGIVILALLLAIQLVHQNRESLATIPAFNNAIGPMYRALGNPLSPAWDITGWRFEVAKGTEDVDKNLTIYSRLGNKSDMPLPYPLIGVSLTDRFEETIGSRILDPADYLPNDLDPRKLVQPGNTFEAVINIQSPAIASPSFRLRACYRAANGQLRCKDDGFK